MTTDDNNRPRSIFDYRLTPPTFVLLVYILTNADNDGVFSEPVQSIVEHTGISMGSVSKGKKELTAKNIISIENIPSGRGHPYHRIQLL